MINEKSQLAEDLNILMRIIWRDYPDITISMDDSILELEIHIDDKNENYYLPFIKKINNTYINIYAVRRININNVVKEYKILR